eukprot:scaffold33845_cov101-Isochrysis_galbana.AAC.2
MYIAAWRRGRRAARGGGGASPTGNEHPDSHAVWAPEWWRPASGGVGVTAVLGLALCLLVYVPAALQLQRSTLNPFLQNVQRSAISDCT